MKCWLMLCVGGVVELVDLGFDDVAVVDDVLRLLRWGDDTEGSLVLLLDILVLLLLLWPAVRDGGEVAVAVSISIDGLFCCCLKQKICTCFLCKWMNGIWKGIIRHDEKFRYIAQRAVTATEKNETQQLFVRWVRYEVKQEKRGMFYGVSRNFFGMIWDWKNFAHSLGKNKALNSPGFCKVGLGSKERVRFNRLEICRWWETPSFR